MIGISRVVGYLSREGGISSHPILVSSWLSLLLSQALFCILSIHFVVFLLLINYSSYSTNFIDK